MVKKREIRRNRLKLWFNENFGKTPGDRAFHIINNTLIILLGLVALYPFVYVVIESLQAYNVSNGVQQVTFSLSAYAAIFSDAGLIWTFVFSMLVTIAGTLASVTVTYMCAYAMSKKYLKGRNVLFYFVLIPMLFSGGLIPSYILIRTLQLKNNVLVYILPSLCSSFNIFIVKNFIAGIPQSMEEAAMIDGANHFQIMTKIYVKLSAPIIATVGLWIAVSKWNDWMTGLLYIDQKELYLMQNYLRTLLNASLDNSTNNPDIMNKGEAVMMASIVVGIAPIILSFPFVQKYFIKGMILGSVKE